MTNTEIVNGLVQLTPLYILIIGGVIIAVARLKDEQA